MARYALFMGNEYYPVGGWSDFHSLGTLDELHNVIVEASAEPGGKDPDWFQIVDLQTWKIVQTGNPYRLAMSQGKKETSSTPKEEKFSDDDDWT